MQTAKLELNQERLAKIVAGFSACRIAILGDFFLDKYLEVERQLEDVSLETGLAAHQVVAIRCDPGAAGTVAANLASLGAGELHAIGFTGDDGESFDLRNALGRLRCSTTHLQTVADRNTPTYLKPRTTGNLSLEAEHSRYDTKNRVPTPVEVEDAIVASIDAVLPHVDAVVIMDQVEEINCGVVTDRVRDAIAERAAVHAQTTFWADSRRRIHEFRRVIIKPNQFEAVGIDNPSLDDQVDLEELRRATERMRERNAAPIVVTRGPRGLVVSDSEWTIVPGVEIAGTLDPTGAGDSVTAGVVLSLCAGATLPEAAIVGNLVASITVQQIGQTGVARADALATVLERWQQQRHAADS